MNQTKPGVRRAKPWIALKIWMGINRIRQEGRQPTLEALLRQLRTDYNIKESFGEELVIKVSDDQLIIREDDYRIPDPVQPGQQMRVDPYCFVCYDGSGKMTGCSSCWRRVHDTCVDTLIADLETYRCVFCMENEQPLQPIRGKCLDTSQIVEVVKLIHQRLFESQFEDMTGVFQTFDAEILQSLGHLLFKSFDYCDLEKKVATEKYASLSRYYEDLKTFEYNINLCFGPSEEADLAAKMIEEFQKERKFLCECYDCFVHFYSWQKYSNWFLQPCDPLHTVVFAKMGRYPWWPCKVIREEEDGKKLVWFFGTTEHRDVLDASCIKLNVSTHNKKTAALKKALDEMETYNQMVATILRKKQMSQSLPQKLPSVSVSTVVSEIEVEDKEESASQSSADVNSEGSNELKIDMKADVVVREVESDESEKMKKENGIDSESNLKTMNDEDRIQFIRSTVKFDDINGGTYSKADITEIIVKKCLCFYNEVVMRE